MSITQIFGMGVYATGGGYDHGKYHGHRGHYGHYHKHDRCHWYGHRWHYGGYRHW